MSTAIQTGETLGEQMIPATMQAAVYRGVNDVRLEEVPVPAVGRGELLIRVHTCGICGTDLKKISTGSHSAPRIFGHETAGVVVATGAGVDQYKIGDRVMVFHHIPCGDCYYCKHKVFAQCPTYKKVGATAGYEPSGGGFAEYVRVMDWIVSRGGVVPIPDGVSFEQASFIEPVNTCMKGIETLRLTEGETVLVIGQGPIGIILSVLARRCGVKVITSDLFPQRLTIAKTFGLNENIDASTSDTVQTIKEKTEGRGADAVILAVAGNGLDSCRHGSNPSGRTSPAFCANAARGGDYRSRECLRRRKESFGFVQRIGRFAGGISTICAGRRDGLDATDQPSISAVRINRRAAFGCPSQTRLDEGCYSAGQLMEGLA